jgi:hypothetical protein
MADSSKRVTGSVEFGEKTAIRNGADYASSHPSQEEVAATPKPGRAVIAHLGLM